MALWRDLRAIGMGYEAYCMVWRSALFEYNGGPEARIVCTMLIADAFQAVNFPVLPMVTEDAQGESRLFKRNAKLFTPADFDTSPYFAVLNFPRCSMEDLTETSPVISVTTPQANDRSSVGALFRDVEITNNPQTGELRVRSPGVMQGYWKRDKATRKMIDARRSRSAASACWSDIMMRSRRCTRGIYKPGVAKLAFSISVFASRRIFTPKIIVIRCIIPAIKFMLKLCRNQCSPYYSRRKYHSVRMYAVRRRYGLRSN